MGGAEAVIQEFLSSAPSADNRVGLFPYLQPQKTLDRKEATVGAEALARFRASDGRLLTPVEFLPTISQMGLHRELLRGMLRGVSCALRSAGRLPRGFRVSVNVDASCIDWHLPRHLRSYLPDAGLAPESLAIELTETALLQDIDMSVTVLSAVRDMGIAVYIDDFGTGYSSLGVLRKLPIDGIKIPREFVSHCNRDKDLKILHSLCCMLRQLGVHAVAEGVETIKQRSLLEFLGCPTAQGFYFSPPVPPDQFAKFL